MRWLTTAPIAWRDVVALEQQVAASGCGAVVTFVGIVRGDEEGARRVVALTYEAYAEMVERQIARLVETATARWSLGGIAIQHRLGLVEVGGISVALIVAAPHRAQGYEASRFLIEQIKHELPIWKRTTYDHGSSQ